MMARRKNRLVPLALLLSALLIATASAAIYYQITASMSFVAKVSLVIFTEGDDTTDCGGSIGTNATSVSFTNSPYIPLAVESDVIITELVNVTNTDSLTRNVKFYLGATDENFGTQLETLKIYVVAPNATEYLMIELDGSGDVTTNNQSVNIPATEEWAIKLVGHYDSGTLSTQSNTMTLRLQVTG